MSKSLEGPLKGQAALVTGAGRRIGRAIALRLAAEGARVAVHYRDSKAEAESVAAEITQRGGNAVSIRADLTRLDEIARLFDETDRRFGRLDILINNAGIFIPARPGETTEAQWDSVLGTNLKAVFFCCQRAAPLLARGGRGRIVNLASLGGLLAWPKYMAYSISKAGVIMLTKCLARDFAPGITVNAIAPGTITFPGEPPDEAYAKSAPLGRTGTADEIASTVIYLVGAAFVTGQVIAVDGGRSIPR